MTVRSRDVTPREHRVEAQRPAPEPRRPAPEPPRPPRPPRRPRVRIGVLSGAQLERLTIVLVQLGAWLLILLSAIGTFYGARGLDAPITDPLRIVREMIGLWSVALLALAGQGLLSLVQWGSRQFARHDPRWWLAYLASLALSAWWNWSAYGDPLVAIGVPWLLALGLVVGGDVFPELALVRDDEQHE